MMILKQTYANLILLLAVILLTQCTREWNNLYDELGENYNPIAEGITSSSATIYKTNTPPEIDGVYDISWNDIQAYNINTPYATEAVSFNGTATWKATWDDNYIYVLVQVPDDDFYPSVELGADVATWLADKPEIYLDVNKVKEDGKGPYDEGTGHYQIAPGFNESNYTDADFAYAASLTIGDDSKNYFVEYAIPFTTLLDKYNQILNPNTRTTIGFDVTVIDFDDVGKGQTTDVIQRINWVNDVLGGKEESWLNLDWSGTLIFSGGSDDVDNNNTVTDYDGNTYPTVTIGTQTWMAKNLKVTHYPNGTAIPLVTDNTDWANLGDNDTDDAFCYYENNSSSEYGALYTYAAALNACPAGWHLPTDEEWTTLENYISNDGFDGNEGTALKATSGWSSFGNGTDNYGFAALPGGYRSGISGLFGTVGTLGYWWSASMYDGIHTYSRLLYGDKSYILRDANNKSTGNSVRCIKD